MNYDSYIESRAFEDEYLEERRRREELREEKEEQESDRKRDEVNDLPLEVGVTMKKENSIETLLMVERSQLIHAVDSGSRIDPEEVRHLGSAS